MQTSILCYCTSHAQIRPKPLRQNFFIICGLHRCEVSWKQTWWCIRVPICQHLLYAVINWVFYKPTLLMAKVAACFKIFLLKLAIWGSSAFCQIIFVGLLKVFHAFVLPLTDKHIPTVTFGEFFLPSERWWFQSVTKIRMHLYSKLWEILFKINLIFIIQI